MRINDRQQQIINLLCQRRSDTVQNLATELGVCERTIRRDIEELTLTYPLETVRGRYGGGVGKDFCRFKEEAGLTGNSRVEESVSPSPFDYRKNCLLYFPAMPPRQHEVDYFDKLAEEIRTLLIAVHGHALVLFTSYAI